MPDENTNPDTGENPESKSQKRKRQLNEAKQVGFIQSSRQFLFYYLGSQYFQALEKVQESEAQQRQVIREQALTIEKLKGDTGTSPEDSNDEQSPHKKKKYNTTSSDDPLRKDALQAGKLFAVQSALWTEPGAVRYMALLNSDGSYGHQSDESETDDDSQVRAQAELIYATLPAHLRPHVKQAWFGERVS
jgi:hypothetical protein